MVLPGAGVMGLMSVWVGGLEKPCTGQFGASAMSAMSVSMSTPATTEHPLKNGTSPASRICLCCKGLIMRFRGTAMFLYLACSIPMIFKFDCQNSSHIHPSAARYSMADSFVALLPYKHCQSLQDEHRERILTPVLMLCRYLCGIEHHCWRTSDSITVWGRPAVDHLLVCRI